MERGIRRFGGSKRREKTNRIRRRKQEVRLREQCARGEQEEIKWVRKPLKKKGPRTFTISER